MSSLTFLMGKHEAQFPTDRVYCWNHMWRKSEGERFRFGLSAYAVRLLQDVYFLDWVFAPPVAVIRGDEIGSIESSKALSSLFAPMDGNIVNINEDLLEDPSTINADAHNEGWLFEMEGETGKAMSPENYLKFLDQAWDKAQKTLKKQVLTED
ncbi:MAG: glycine cleavage system protein H [Planctomycetota bacterium]|nr:glycine cleavage system protein H [Planctomycetota bacterium]